MTRMLIVLAVGEGTGTHPELPKALQPLLGLPLLDHVLHAAEPLAASPVQVVTDHRHRLVETFLAEHAPHATPVRQDDRPGTGRAVRAALDAAGERTGTVVVLPGDAPLLRTGTLSALVAAHEREGSAATVLTAAVTDPAGRRRVVRGEDGRVELAEDGLMEGVQDGDAAPPRPDLTEIDGGVYVFDADALRMALGKLAGDDDTREAHLTDVLGVLRGEELPVRAHRTPDAAEVIGCGDLARLADARAVLRDRINRLWLERGVAITEPATTWIDATVELAAGTVVEPGVHLRGTTRVGPGATVGPDTTLVNTEVGADAHVLRAHAVDARIGAEATVGPYAYLRPGSELGPRTKVGTFVEVKQSVLGEGTQVAHLAYVGNATLGADVNIGAGTTFSLYDGVDKHPTRVGDAAFIGCNTSLVAPVDVGAGAFVAAGSVITERVPGGSLAIARARQNNVAGWVERRRPGTVWAAAARSTDE
ncbi:bifunctional UDP-N-acetylglucosamine diphosphorylase/glucosamine-1-phosphate N-acetyltransferase GlmU [Streptomyces sp. NPDC018610]|uniref:bifunctional UDP-N-acetylglucosamine diphosphorylase/glucosamine-1-phosphate N-acetyltransferase GlmU n=1 Tax=Streptomyces sp. NPDC018610 TaxID=3365049 RepID=UPI0037AD00B2